MGFHFIAIMSHYGKGSRIGWHYADENKLKKETIQDFLTTVKGKCGDIQLGIHKLSTNSVSWESVVKKDSFFDDVFVTSCIDTFTKLANEDQELKAYDVAKFILSALPSSHLKLQKLIYFAYAEFLLRTGEKMFNDKIEAYKYGPVVQEVFYKYRSKGSSVIDYKEDETFIIHADEIAVTPSFMKIASSENGLVALECILETLKKYKLASASDLVDKTHRAGGPWERVYKPGLNAEITDELIKQYHYVTS